MQFLGNGKVRVVDQNELEAAMHEHGLMWVNLETPSKDELAQLKKIFRLHPLTLENLVAFNQRPKTEEYSEYLFLITHAINYESGKIKISEIDFVLGRNYLLSSSPSHIDAIVSLKERISKEPAFFEKGSAFLLYSVIDAIVDSYFPIVDTISEEFDALESEIFTNPNKKTLNKLFKLKRGLLQFRRTVNAQRETFNFLGRQESDLVPSEYRVYFRDVYDHLIRVSESIDTYREVISDSMDAYLSVISNRLNEIMKVLTIIATIILPMSLVASFYGMNVDFPEYALLGKRETYFFAVGAMLLIIIIMLYWFRKNKWL